jgi:DNA-binding LacI/PurR family transcriptional regulator/anti-anti-sigma regulatory factor
MVSGHKAIGVLAPQLSGDYFGILFTGIYAVTRRHDPRLIAIQGTPREIFSSRLAWDQVDGWIIINNADGLDQTAPPGVPLVTLGVQVPGVDCPAVFPDNHGGMRTAVLHLIGHGHQRIGFVGNLAHNDVRQRYEGYQAALAQHGLPLDPALVVSVADTSERSGADAVQRLLAAGVTFTALAAGTDENALGVMAAAQTAGYRVPEDLAVVGFDDVLLAHASTPPLTTVRVPIQALGSTAAELLLAQIAGQAVPRGATYVDTAFIPRRSCDCSVTVLAPTIAEGQSVSWREALEQQLTRLARYPLPPDPATQLREIWPGGETLINALADALEGQAAPTSAALYEAWQEIVAVSENLEVLQAILKALEDAGARQMAASPEATARAAMETFIDRLRIEMLRARVAHETAVIRSYSALVHQNYHISVTLLAKDSANTQNLAWLRQTPLSWGCFGVWDSVGNDAAALVVAGLYRRDTTDGDATPQIGTRYAAPIFPPPELIPRSVYETDGDIIALLPIKTADQNRGMLALACPIPYLRSSGNHDMLTGLATLLGAALERESLLETLRTAYERERSLGDIVRALGSPVIPLLPEVLLVPLVGTIGASRAQQIIEAILEGVNSHQATSVLIDITGVPLVDTQVANSLLQAARAATLLGAKVVLVGVRPEIAQSIVGLGIELPQLATRPTLAAAVQSLLKERGQTHIKSPRKATTF